MTARTTPTTASASTPEPPHRTAPDTDRTHGVEHPAWCDPALCTADTSATMGGAHRSTPVTVAAARALGCLTVSAGLYQAHARWLTDVFVTLDMIGLDEHWQPTTVRATVTVEQTGDLARVLTELAAIGAAWQSRQAVDYVSTLSLAG